RLAEPVVRSAAPLGPALPRLGVRFVLLLHEADWRAQAGRVAGLAVAARGPDLTLYRSDAPVDRVSFSTPAVAPVIAGDVFALVLVAGAALTSFRRGRSGPLR